MLEIIGTIFIIIVGCLSHFLYDLTNHNKIIGYLAAVNESTWEHLKLVIFPTFLWLIVEYHFYFNNPMLIFARFISLLVMSSFNCFFRLSDLSLVSCCLIFCASSSDIKCSVKKSPKLSAKISSNGSSPNSSALLEKTDTPFSSDLLKFSFVMA